MKALFKSFRWRRVAVAVGLLALPVAAFATTVACGGCPLC